MVLGEIDFGVDQDWQYYCDELCDYNFILKFSFSFVCRWLWLLKLSWCILCSLLVQKVVCLCNIVVLLSIRIFFGLSLICSWQVGFLSVVISLVKVFIVIGCLIILVVLLFCWNLMFSVLLFRWNIGWVLFWCLCMMVRVLLCSRLRCLVGMCWCRCLKVSLVLVSRVFLFFWVLCMYCRLYNCFGVLRKVLLVCSLCFSGVELRQLLIYCVLLIGMMLLVLVCGWGVVWLNNFLSVRSFCLFLFCLLCNSRKLNLLRVWMIVDCFWWDNFISVFIEIFMCLRLSVVLNNLLLRFI